MCGRSANLWTGCKCVDGVQICGGGASVWTECRLAEIQFLLQAGMYNMHNYVACQLKLCLSRSTNCTSCKDFIFDCGYRT